MSERIQVAVVGAAGRMGKTVCAAVIDDPMLDLTAAIDRVSLGEPVPGVDLVVERDLQGAFDSRAVDVVVDFSLGEAVLANATLATANGAHVVIGATGTSAADRQALEQLALDRQRNILLAPNFAVGAILMMKMAQMGAAYCDRAEIIELHHDKKLDAPSGTAILTAQLMAEQLVQGDLGDKETVSGARGGDVGGIPIHSVRLPGFVAHQEVILGFLGQTLTIRHDSVDRTSFMPGVILAVKKISEYPGFTYGLDKFLDL